MSGTDIEERGNRTTVDLSFVLSTPSFEAIAPSASAAAGGATRVWSTEAPGRDAFARAVEIGSVDPSLQVGTGIAYAFTRHPLATAAAAIEVNELVGGRFRLGLGVGPADFRRALNVEFDHPAPRLAEYIALVRAALDAEAGLHFDGRFYSTNLPAYRSSVAIERRRAIEVYGSGLTRTAVRAVAQTADGIALHPLGIATGYLDEVVLPEVETARTERPFGLAAWCVVSVDSDIEAALSRARARLALYLSVPGLDSVVAGTPWATDVARVQERARGHAVRQDWATLGRELPEDLVHAFAVVATPAELGLAIERRVAPLARRGIDEVVFQVAAPTATPDEFCAELKEISGALGRT